MSAGSPALNGCAAPAEEWESRLREVRLRKALCLQRGYMRLYINAEWDEAGLVRILKRIRREEKVRHIDGVQVEFPRT